jgi:hypothetical protein
MVPKHGGSFDDPFFRETISPNVNFFQRLKEEMETAFGLKCHRKTHTSASDTDEIRASMAMYRREDVHLFCAGRSLDHKANDQINTGYTTLENGKLRDFIRTSTERAEVLSMICKHRQASSRGESQTNSQDRPIAGEDDDTASDSDSSSSDGSLSNPESVHSEDADLDSGETVESTIGGSEWVFHMDEGDNGGWEEERSEGEESEDEDRGDQDVDANGWLGENDVPDDE